MTIKGAGRHAVRAAASAAASVSAVHRGRTAHHIRRLVDTDDGSWPDVKPRRSASPPRPRSASRLRRHAARRLPPGDITVLRITEIREKTAQGGDPCNLLGCLSVLGIVTGAVVLGIVAVHRVVPHPQTDDAIAMADTIGVVPQVSGTIAELHVADNQVKEGAAAFAFSTGDLARP
jgi:hypothetical protein